MESTSLIKTDMDIEKNIIYKKALENNSNSSSSPNSSKTNLKFDTSASNISSLKDEAQDYLFAGKSLTAGPVSLSISASFMSALTMLGWPTEFYLFGSMFFYFVFTYLFSAILAAKFFIPLFYNSGYNSTYEFLSKRFNCDGLKIICEIVYIINTCLYAGIVCYAPALALNIVLGLNLWGGVMITALVCTFYTTLGGLKAVIWTDVFQSVIMVSGFVMICLKGISDFGFSTVINNAIEGGRLDLTHFNLDLTQRHTVWSIILGGTFGLWGGTFCCNQTEVQRYLSCKNLKEAQKSVFYAIFYLWILVVLGGFSGFVMFSYYKYCDPIKAGWVYKHDQLIPYMISDIFRDFPGLTGLYIASIYSGTLSTVSSGINSMATVTLLDFVDPVLTKLGKKSDSIRNILMKILVFVFGLCCILTAYVADKLGGVLEAAMSVNGIVFGPTLGLFVLAGFIQNPKISNKYGASAGYLTGILLGIWVYLGSKMYPAGNDKLLKLDTFTHQCQNMTGAGLMEAANPQIDPKYENYPEIAENFYSMSYLFTSTFGLIGTIVSGVAVSFITYLVN